MIKICVLNAEGKIDVLTFAHIEEKHPHLPFLIWYAPIAILHSFSTGDIFGLAALNYFLTGEFVGYSSLSFKVEL